MNASVYRTTRFELASVEQKGDHFVVKASERGVHHTAPPPLEIHQDAITEARMVKIQEALELFELLFDEVYQARATTPQAAHEALALTFQAEQRLAAAQAEHARLDEEMAKKRAEHARLDAEIAKARVTNSSALDEAAIGAGETPA